MSGIKMLPLFFIFMAGILVPHFGDKATAAEAGNDQAPSFTFKLLNGGDFKSSDLRGKVAVLKFVASY